MHGYLDAARQRIRELEHGRRLLEERIVQLQETRDALKTVAQQVIAAWDRMPDHMRRETSIDFHTAIHGLIMAIEEGQGDAGPV